ncbi:uncharacterized protein LOC106052907 isoform X1 [Biomphalaria glabrata]|uniref:Uncharacterized protein LOC106052907 isoform X1 n=1 Tax=Biomphalaria glabrata TaxID=6526 RepID=A0A9W3APQ3_BIOGL|nr:uncharacterized protein LOC106052907 isoform X1 [Biomphalaria glabrata]XP_055889247.1 uncharacterized protein LOC106052907 isoform X1 [Biomphalaria glabrata]XP_055889248.1 uncharacterized protein LOC106052907 isoform X1 [Biomphalaria glabrata]
MSDRLVGNMTAVTGPSAELDCGHDHSMNLLGEMLHENMDEQLLAAISGQNKLNIYELIRKLQLRNKESDTVRARQQLNGSDVSEANTGFTAKRDCPKTLPDVYISQEALQRLSTQEELLPNPQASSTCVDPESFRPAVKKRTIKANEKLDNSSTKRVTSAGDVQGQEKPKINTEPFLEMNVSQIEDCLMEDTKSFLHGNSEDSGCFSCDSKRKCNLSEQHGVVDDNNVKHKVDTCGACRQDMPVNQNGLCKNCWNKIKMEHRDELGGTLGDFKAYAKCIAHSVRKILDLKPAKPESEEVAMEENTSETGQITKANVLHRYPTDISPASEYKVALPARSLTLDGVSPFSREVQKLSAHSAGEHFTGAAEAELAERKKLPRTKSVKKAEVNSGETATVKVARRKLKHGTERSKTEVDMKQYEEHQKQNRKPNENNQPLSQTSVEGTPVDPPSERNIKSRLMPYSRSVTSPLKTTRYKNAQIHDLHDSKSATKLAKRSSNLRKGKVNLSLADVRADEVSKVDTRRRATSYDVVAMSSPRYNDLDSGEERPVRRPKQVSTSVPVKPLPKARTKLPVKQTVSSPTSEQIYSGVTFRQASKPAEAPIPAPRTDKKMIPVSEKEDIYCKGVQHLPVALECQLKTLPVAPTVLKEPVISKSSCQYFHPLETLSSVRDRAHESKPSTQVRSSHSDDALLRTQADVYYTKKGVNGETDVDTGLVHHFSKRQAARSHVLPYYDFPSGQNIYTMSGDVTISSSSNSGTSLKSEVSDVYTGGFLKEEPIYEHESNGDNSSVSSVGPIYFEPTYDAPKHEASDQDIYTGAVFSTNRNANGSMNNSTRPLLNRVSRCTRGKPRIDRVLDRNMEITGVLQHKIRAHAYQQEELNRSNNSNQAPYYDFKGEEIPQPTPKITLSDSSSYTGFTFRYQKQPSPQPKKDFQKNIDFSKYEIQETANTGFFFQSPKKIESDEIWYRGPYLAKHPPPSTLAQQVEYPTVTKLSPAQDDDDCYTNIICPKFRNSNNNATDDGSSDLNNNHLYSDDYTSDPSDAKAATGSGFYEEASSKFAPQNNFFLKSGVNAPQSPPNVFSDRSYSESPSKNYVSGLYGQSDSDYAPPFSFKNSQTPPNMSSYNKAPQSFPENMSSFYTASSGDASYNKYEKSHHRMPYGPSDDYSDMPKQLYNNVPAAASTERDSYFDYAASRNPSAGLFLDKKLDDLSLPRKSPPALPVVNEIKKVGGIVCRDNVVNKEDYAEDVNRDLMDEPGAWVSFKYRDEEPRFVKELAGGRGTKVNTTKETVGKLAKAVEESSYAHNQMYDSVGARNNWREMNQDHSAKVKEASRHKTPTKVEKKEKTVYRPADQIPERAMGKRTQHPSKPPVATTTSATPQPIPPTILDGNNNTSQPESTRNPSSAKTPKRSRSSQKVSNISKTNSKKVVSPEETKQTSTSVLVDEMVFVSPKNGEKQAAQSVQLATDQESDTAQPETKSMDCAIM